MKPHSDYCSYERRLRPVSYTHLDVYKRQELREVQFPGLDVLRKRVGLVVANNAAELLGLLRNEGESAARERFSKATYYRLRGLLKDEGLL